MARRLRSATRPPPRSRRLSADAPPPAPNRAAPYAIPAAAGLGGAILGAALALLAAWLIDPRAGALDETRARLAAVEKSIDAQSAATAALDRRMATVEAGAVKASALDALGRRLGALEAAGGDAKAALDEARAARADAAKALAAPPAASLSTTRPRRPNQARSSRVWPSSKPISPPPMRG